MADITPARFPEDREAVLAIFREFVASPSVSLAHQNNEQDFASLPGKYAPPGGVILLARRGDRVVGCGSLRRVDPAICEMKRLYVRPEARGERLGSRLVEALIGHARLCGYAEVRLDVLAEFEAAQGIYRAFGFVPAPPVSDNPLPGTQFLGLKL